MACEDSGLRVRLKPVVRERDAGGLELTQALGTSTSTPNVESACVAAPSGVYSLSDAMTCGVDLINLTSVLAF